MKSFNQFLNEAERVPERQQLNLGISPGQQSLPGMGRRGQGSGQGKPVKKAQYNPKYYNKDGTRKPNAVQTYIQGRMAGPYNRPGVKLTPEIKAKMDAANATFASAAKGDEAASKQVAQWTKEFDAKHGLTNKPEAPANVVTPSPRTPTSQQALRDIKADKPSSGKSGAETLRSLIGSPQRPNPVSPTQPAPAPTAAQVRPRGQGSRPVGSTTSRGGIQLPNLPKPKVTVGRGVQVVGPPTATQSTVAKAVETQRASSAKPDMPTQIRQTAAQVMSDREKAKLDRSTQRATAIGKAALPVTQGLGAYQSYTYGRSQGDTAPQALARATLVPGVSAAAAKRVGKALIKRRLPSWAVPAAAATYGAVEPAAQWGFNKIKEFMRGNK